MRIKRNPLFRTKTHYYKWFQTILIILIFIGFLYGIKTLFGKKSKIYNYVKNAKNLCLQGNFDLAMEEYKKAIKINPEEPIIYDGIGFLNVIKGEIEAAKENYNIARIKGLKYNKIFDHKKFGFDYISKGKYNLSLIEFEHYNQLKPNDLQGLIGLGLSLHALGEINKAIEIYQKSQKLNPKNPEIQRLLEKAKSSKDNDTITYIYDRNLQPLLKKSISRNTMLYPGGPYTDKIIGYNNEKYKKLGLEYNLKDFIPGNEIILTIDLNLQKIASAKLEGVGSVVIIKPQTGEILAAVSHPRFDPNNIEKNWIKYKTNKNDVFLNRAFESLYEPGSICKIITTAAFLESNINIKNIFPVKCNGVTMIENKGFWCWHKHGIIKTLDEAIDQSCNIAFAKLGLELGNDKIYEYANKFGFNFPIQLQLPVSTSTLPLEVEDKFDIAERSNGLGKNFRITPLNAALIAAVVANNGVLMKPYIVKEIKNIRGETIYQENPTVLKNSISKETAEKLTKLMIDAVEHGLGKKAKIEGIKIAGKTGTSKTTKKGLDGWFICFAPSDNPQIAMAIICEQAGMGMDVAAPIAQKILLEILKK